jgi:hypothetical protein
MEPNLQDPTTGPCIDQDESIPHASILFVKIYFNITLTSMIRPPMYQVGLLNWFEICLQFH